MAVLPYDKIPHYIRPGSYQVDLMWRSIERTLVEFAKDEGLDLDPDFQRAHVWTLAQQKAYVEFVLRGGQTGKILYFNCFGWNGGHDGVVGPIILVDGKQRLEAVRKFIRDEFTVFDDFPGLGPTLCSEVECLREIDCRFSIYINSLHTRAEVLKWYLQINEGGTPHTSEELLRVQTLYAKELANQFDVVVTTTRSKA